MHASLILQIDFTDEYFASNIDFEDGSNLMSDILNAGAKTVWLDHRCCAEFEVGHECSDSVKAKWVAAIAIALKRYDRAE